MGRIERTDDAHRAPSKSPQRGKADGRRRGCEGACGSAWPCHEGAGPSRFNDHSADLGWRVVSAAGTGRLPASGLTAMPRNPIPDYLLKTSVGISEEAGVSSS